MTSKEKAKELVDKLLESLYDNGGLSFKKILYSKAKQCALIAVDEILAADMFIMTEEQEKYWEQVKTEIEKL